MKGILNELRVIISKDKDLEEAGYGKELGTELELNLVEAAYLLKKKKIEIIYEKKKLKFKDFLKYAEEKERNFHARFIVYSDLRERGFIVRTGLKFGCDFRVYDRGVKIKKGRKAAHEHTKWIVHAIPEEFTCSFPELSRAVRLAQNIRAEMIWAIVDCENDVTYFSIKRITP
ncbi:MAG: tRNA-intron lyase [Candidatus Aenigmarchaeota archaeon]|nr:tRNA-intron lyase [Candidatus Aenigmarchaeota archaeon]